MWCEGKEEKVVWKSLGMLIYRATLLLSQCARVAGTCELRDRSRLALHGDFRTCTCEIWDRSRVAIPGDFQSLHVCQQHVHFGTGAE